MHPSLNCNAPLNLQPWTLELILSSKYVAYKHRPRQSFVYAHSQLKLSEVKTGNKNLFLMIRKLLLWSVFCFVRLFVKLVNQRIYKMRWLASLIVCLIIIKQHWIILCRADRKVAETSNFKINSNQCCYFGTRNFNRLTQHLVLEWIKGIK